MPLPTVQYTPIGLFHHAAQRDKRDAPRQGVHAGGAGTIVLERQTGIEHALVDLERWQRVWIVFHFDRASGFRPTVWPPRSSERRGVLATRSPHRPNPIGLTAARLLSVDVPALTLHVAEADLLDATPVLDLKPYVAYADAFPDAGDGWLTPQDPLPPWQVELSAEAERAVAWLEARGVDLRTPVCTALALGPTPQPYRRIRARGAHMELACKEWRADFVVHEARRTLEVQRIRSGYRPQQLATDPTLTLHRDFSARGA